LAADKPFAGWNPIAASKPIATSKPIADSKLIEDRNQITARNQAAAKASLGDMSTGQLQEIRQWLGIPLRHENRPGARQPAATRDPSAFAGF
jgi:hypothetical protein